MTTTQSPANPHAAGKAAHTPGPWIAQRDCRGGPNNTLAEAYGIYGPQTRIAVMETEQDWRPQPEIDANARLIAAAPELLEALEKVAALEDDAEKIPYPLKVRFRLAISGAIEAIARATGQGEGQQ